MSRRVTAWLTPMVSLRFLSDVESGGETFFPKGSVLQSESVGFGVKPAKVGI
jgi:hypothetical protein